MSLTINHDGMDGTVEFDTESYSWPVLRAYPNPGGAYAYLGGGAQDDLRDLAKAILNAVEPKALVENQKDVEPERDLAAEVDTLTARVTDLEAAADTEIRVGDTVRVQPDDWNIPTPSGTRGRAVTGEVIQIVHLGGKKRYLVQFRSLSTDNLTALYAVKATKEYTRG